MPASVLAVQASTSHRRFRAQASQLRYDCMESRSRLVASNHASRQLRNSSTSTGRTGRSRMISSNINARFVVQEDSRAQFLAPTAQAGFKHSHLRERLLDYLFSKI